MQCFVRPSQRTALVLMSERSREHSNFKETDVVITMRAKKNYNFKIKMTVVNEYVNFCQCCWIKAVD